MSPAHHQGGAAHRGGAPRRLGGGGSGQAGGEGKRSMLSRYGWYIMAAMGYYAYKAAKEALANAAGGAAKKAK